MNASKEAEVRAIISYPYKGPEGRVSQAILLTLQEDRGQNRFFLPGCPLTVRDGHYRTPLQQALKRDLDLKVSRREGDMWSIGSVDVEGRTCKLYFITRIRGGHINVNSASVDEPILRFKLFGYEVAIRRFQQGQHRQVLGLGFLDVEGAPIPEDRRSPEVSAVLGFFHQNPGFRNVYTQGLAIPEPYLRVGTEVREPLSASWKK